MYSSTVSPSFFANKAYINAFDEVNQSCLLIDLLIIKIKARPNCQFKFGPNYEVRFITISIGHWTAPKAGVSNLIQTLSI